MTRINSDIRSTRIRSRSLVKISYKPHGNCTRIASGRTGNGSLKMTLDELPALASGHLHEF